MKFLQDEQLAKITAELTDAVDGSSDRVIHGRIEAFTMKRAGTDKRFAHLLAVQLQQEISTADQERAKRMNKAIAASSELSEETTQRRIRRKNKNKKVRHGTTTAATTTAATTTTTTTTIVEAAAAPLPILKKSGGKRARAASLDLTRPRFATLYSPSPLGDLHQSSNRRLMTDLILTLNASFPDYDFSSVRPCSFVHLHTPAVIQRIQERLAGVRRPVDFSGDFFTRLWTAIDQVISIQESEVYSYAPPTLDEDEDPMEFLTQSSLTSDTDLLLLPLWTFNYFFVNKTRKRIVLFTCVSSMRTSDTSSFRGTDTGILLGMDEDVTPSEGGTRRHSISSCSGSGSSHSSSSSTTTGGPPRIRHLLPLRRTLINEDDASHTQDEDDDDDIIEGDYDMEDRMVQAVSAPTL